MRKTAASNNNNSSKHKNLCAQASSHHVKISDKNKKQHLRTSIYTLFYSARLINTVVELSFSSYLHIHSRLHKS